MFTNITNVNKCLSRKYMFNYISNWNRLIGQKTCSPSRKSYVLKSVNILNIRKDKLFGKLII